MPQNCVYEMWSCGRVGGFMWRVIWWRERVETETGSGDKGILSQKENSDGSTRSRVVLEEAESWKGRRKLFGTGLMGWSDNYNNENTFIYFYFYFKWGGGNSSTWGTKRKANKNGICCREKKDIEFEGLCHLFCGLVSVWTHSFINGRLRNWELLF